MARPFVLWLTRGVVSSSRLERPSTILTAAAPADVAVWRRRSPWASSIELVHWNAEGWGAPFRDPDPAGVPWCVDPAPPAGFFVDRRGDYDVSAWWLAAREYVRQVEAARPGGVWWEVMADASHGLLALAAAKETGRCVALGAAPMGLVGVSLAAQHGIEVSTRELPLKGLRFSPREHGA